MTGKRAAKEAFALANHYFDKFDKDAAVLPIDDERVTGGLDWLEKSLAYQVTPEALQTKADVFRRVGNYQGCINIFEELRARAQLMDPIRQEHYIREAVRGGLDCAVVGARGNTDPTLWQEAANYADNLVNFATTYEEFQLLGDIFQEANDFSRCSASFQWIVSHESQADRKSKTRTARALYRKLACDFRTAEIIGNLDGWRDVVFESCPEAYRSRSAMVKGMRGNVIQHCWDALLKLSESRGDFRLFAQSVIYDSEIEGAWKSLYYHFHGKTLPQSGALSPDAVAEDACNFSREIGRSSDCESLS